MRVYAKRKRLKTPRSRNSTLNNVAYRSPLLAAQQDNIHNIIHEESVQAKFHVGQPNDRYEQQAEQVSGQLFSSAGRETQHNMEKDRKYDAKNPPIHHLDTSRGITNFNAIKGSGYPLEPVSRQFFESRLGYNFGQVRIHSDDNASNEASSMNARAYTHGNHIVMDSNEYQPHSYEGRKLLGHELTHVIQQTGWLEQNKSQNKSLIVSPSFVAHPASGMIQMRRRRRRRRSYGPPPSTFEVIKAVLAAKILLMLPEIGIHLKIYKQRQLEHYYNVLHGLRRRLLNVAGRSRDEQRLFHTRNRVKANSTRLYWNIFRTREYKAVLAAERAAKLRTQRQYLLKLAKRYPIPLLRKTVAADKLMAMAEQVKLPPPTSATGRVIGKMSHRRALSELIMANTPVPTITPTELATHKREASINYHKAVLALFSIDSVRIKLQSLTSKLISEHRALYSLMTSTRVSSLSHIPKLDRAFIHPAANKGVKGLLKAWKQSSKLLRKANRQWKKAFANERMALKALNPKSIEARQAILERRLHKMGRRSIAQLEARAAQALKGKYAAWAVSVIVKYAGIPWGDASKWGGKHPYSQRWRRLQVPRTLSHLVILIKAITGKNRKLRRRLINMLKRYPRVVQATCDQVAELLLRARGFKLGWGSLGLTGQARWYIKQAVARRPGTIAHFKVFNSISDAPVGSALFFPKWTAKAGRWQIAASHPNFKPVMHGFNLANAKNFPLVTETPPIPVTHNGFEYWHVTPGTLSLLNPKIGGALLYKRYKHLKNLGFWVRFPIGNYSMPEVFRWKHISTVIKVQGNKLICFESGWKPSHAHITPGKSVSYLKGRNAFVGYVSGP